MRFKGVDISKIKPDIRKRKFDLNIEEVLDGWEVKHAIREIIANALDEQIITNTKDIEILQTGKKSFIIRDYGRGIKETHLTQNENEEKTSGNFPVIGKFGVGLKDALAVFDRRGVKIQINSRHCKLTTEQTEKHEFNNITTLHALVEESGDVTMSGTEVILTNVEQYEMDGAKSLFRKFNNEEDLELTEYGDIIRKQINNHAHIYVNGVLIATEDNFLFSYDITKPTKKMKKLLNRERTNVGRQAYTDRIKSILLESKNTNVASVLANDIGKYETGQQHDETKWMDVSIRACKILNASDKQVIFVTTTEQRLNTDIMDYAYRENKLVITIPDNIRSKLSGMVDDSGNKMCDINKYISDIKTSFKFQFVNPNNFSSNEKHIWNNTKSILEIVGAEYLAKYIYISETMRPGQFDADGLWTGKDIIIKRSALSNFETYAGVLLHEAAHATSGASDVTREFELELSRMLGMCAKTIKNLKII